MVKIFNFLKSYLLLRSVCATACQSEAEVPENEACVKREELESPLSQAGRRRLPLALGAGLLSSAIFVLGPAVRYVRPTFNSQSHLRS